MFHTLSQLQPTGEDRPFHLRVEWQLLVQIQSTSLETPDTYAHAPHLCLELLGLQSFPSPNLHFHHDVLGLLSFVSQKVLLPFISTFTNKILRTLLYVKMGRRKNSSFGLRRISRCSLPSCLLPRKGGKEGLVGWG